MGTHDAKPTNATRGSRTRGERLAQPTNVPPNTVMLPPLATSAHMVDGPTNALAGDDNCPVIHADSVNFGFSLGGRLRVIFYGGQNDRV